MMNTTKRTKTSNCKKPAPVLDDYFSKLNNEKQFRRGYQDTQELLHSGAFYIQNCLLCKSYDTPLGESEDQCTNDDVTAFDVNYEENGRSYCQFFAPFTRRTKKGVK